MNRSINLDGLRLGVGLKFDLEILGILDFSN
jgi:hypothetical protein